MTSQKGGITLEIYEFTMVLASVNHHDDDDGGGVGGDGDGSCQNDRGGRPDE